MKELDKIVSYDTIKNLTWILKVEKLYLLPVLRNWYTDEDLNKISEKDRNKFLFTWSVNSDYYFSEKINNDDIEELENVIFSKKELNKKKYSDLDYDEETKVYLYMKK